MLKILSFRVGDRLFGIETKYVKEINRNVEFTQVPMAPGKIVGLLNMRGQVVTLFNLSYMFGYANGVDQEQKMCIIIKTSQSKENQVGLLIQSTEDVFDLSEECCENLPANSDETENKYVTTVAKLENELLLVIDSEKLIHE